MFSYLPKLFDRNFAVGYVFPCSLFLIASYQIIRRLSNLGWFVKFASSDVTTRATTFLTIAAALATLLAFANTFLIRRLEGYGWPFNILPKLKIYQVQKYRDILFKLEDYEENWDMFVAAGADTLGTTRHIRDQLLRRLILYFPDSETGILPTSVGNVIRAFEIYPRVMYGLDAIPGWTRIISIIPDSYLRYTLDAKNKMDFCVNATYLLAAMLLINIISLLFPRHAIIILFIIVLNVLLIVLFWFMLQSSAILWGNYFKSCFDLYIDELASQLGYAPPLSKDLWTNISQAFLYPDELPPKPRRSQLAKR
jgi:hypothetical protein